MIKTKSIGTIILAALLGFLTIFLAAPKKMKKSQEGKRENNLFI
jgi:hypothetical protein